MDDWNSLPAMLLGLAAVRGSRPMLRHWTDGGWRGIDWAGFATAVVAAAYRLRAHGVAPRAPGLLVSENRPEFLIAETAILSLGAVAVPTYTTNTVADHAHILRDSGASAAIVSSPSLAARLTEAAGTIPLSPLVVIDEGASGLSWRALTAGPGDPARLAADIAALRPDALACLIYTSGTGGLPRGVMLPHRSMLANQRGLRQAVARLALDGERYLSFLPLSHAYEHTVGNYLLPSLGMEVVYSRGADRLAAELRDIEPAFVTAVPRLFEVLRARIEAEIARQPAWRRRLFARAVSLGLRRLDGPSLSLAETLEDAVLDRLVRRRVQARFGRRLVGLVSGGARLDPDLSGYFLALGVPVLQGYGQTEAGPVVSVNLPWDNDRRSVGRPLPGVEASIAPDGELLLRGDLVMAGYWPPAAIADADAAGMGGQTDHPRDWLRTGDLGRIEDGRLFIEDRKRDVIKTLGGDMISPARIEGLLMAEPEIAQAVIAGEGQATLVALIAAAEGADPSQAVSRVNARLSRIERVRRWGAIPPCTIENGLLTPTAKIRRRLVLERHAAALAALVDDRASRRQASVS